MTDRMFEDFEIVECSLDVIDEGERVRKDYGNLHELKNSFKENSLGQPLIVVRHPDLENGKYEYKLAAGGRRFRALNMLSAETGKTTIPCRVLPDNDEHTVAQWELVENAHRKAFTWHEEVVATKKAHEAYQTIYGKSSGHHTHGGHSQTATAKELHVSKATVSKHIAMADMLEKLPPEVAEKVKAAPNAHQAATMIKSATQRALKARDAKQASESWDKTDHRGALLKSYIVCDLDREKPLAAQGFFEKAHNLDDGSFDIIEIDPPYAIDLKESKKNAGDSLEVYNEVSVEDYRDFMFRTISESVRIAKPSGAHIIVWYAVQYYNMLHDIVDELKAAGARVFWNANPAYWVKTGAQGQTMDQRYRLGSVVERFVYIRVGDGRVNVPGRSNCFNYAPIPSQKKWHPTQRPLDLMIDVLKTFAKPGSKLCVPFAGSGQTLLAGHKLQMEGLAFDLSEEYRNGFIMAAKEMLEKEEK